MRLLTICVVNTSTDDGEQEGKTRGMRGKCFFVSARKCLAGASLLDSLVA